MKALDKEYTIEDAESPVYIEGRTGKIIVDGKEIGYMGEINPKVLNNLRLKMPVVALEINLDSLL